MRIGSTVLNSLRTLKFVWNLGTKEGFSNPFKGMQSPKDCPMYILANGPSLKEFLEKIETDFTPYKNAEFFVVNDFVQDHRFELIKPRYYVMSDPLFFRDTIYSERGHRAMDALDEKVHWKMTLFVPMLYRNSSYTQALKENSNIKICYFHSLHYCGNPALRNWFYSKGLGNGEYGTVALNAIYSAIMLGYKTIRLYGFDHTFFDNITVNNQNQLCYKDTHFYGQDNALRPMLNHYNGNLKDLRAFRVSEFLYEKARLFKGHEIMNDFARYMNVRIINCTPNSMVDEYERIIF